MVSVYINPWWIPGITRKLTISTFSATWAVYVSPFSVCGSNIGELGTTFHSPPRNAAKRCLFLRGIKRSSIITWGRQDRQPFFKSNNLLHVPSCFHSILLAVRLVGSDYFRMRKLLANVFSTTCLMPWCTNKRTVCCTCMGNCLPHRGPTTCQPGI